ncbi:hypothetical protein OWR28_11650 [Chryseobacterium sp. 1B4]
MKPLLTKTTKPFLIYVLIVLMISIPVYYIVVDTIWKSELDEHNEIIIEKTAYEFNRLKLSDEALEKVLNYGITFSLIPILKKFLPARSEKTQFILMKSSCLLFQNKKRNVTDVLKK